MLSAVEKCLADKISHDYDLQNYYSVLLFCIEGGIEL